MTTCGKPAGLAASFSWQRRQRLATSGSMGLSGAGVVGVFGQGSVAGFAGDMGVACRRRGPWPDLRGRGRRCPGRRRRSGVGADGVEGAGPVVAVFAEVLRHNGGADDHEEAERGEEDERRADEMGRIPENAVQVTTPFVVNATEYGRALGTKDTKRPVILKMLSGLDFCGDFRRLMAFPTV